MTCPECGGECRSIEARATTNNAIRRRRLCTACGGKFTTYEVVAADSYVAQSMAVTLNYTRRKVEPSRDPNFCKHGHDKRVVGTRQRMCETCKRNSERASQAYRYQQEQIA